MSNNYLFKLSIFSIILLGLSFVLSVGSLEANPVMATLVPVKKVNKIYVSTTADVLSPVDGECSLREAVISANTNPSSGIVQAAGECEKGSDSKTDQIMLASGETYFLTLAGSGEDASQSGDLDIANNSAKLDIKFSVDGNENDRPTIDGSGLNDRIFEVGEANVLYDHMILGNSNSGENGGGVYNHSGTVSFDSCVIKGMEGIIGGGIYNDTGEVVLTGSTMINNHASGAGGAIYNGEGGMLTIDSTFLVLNNSLNNGGGIANEGGTVLFTQNDGQSVFNGNIAETRGGAINNAGGKISGEGVQIIANQTQGLFTDGVGGGIHNELGGEIDLSDTHILQNEAEKIGSGIYNQGMNSTLVLSDSAIYAHEFNSGVENEGDLTLIDTEVYENGGGGIVSKGGNLKVLRSKVYKNTNGSGGGFHLTGSTDVKIYQSAIYENSANVGGGMHLSQSSLEMVNTTVSGNKTMIGIGGGIHFHSGFAGERVRFYNVTVANNQPASNKGAALSFIQKDIDIELVNTILTGPLSATVCHNGTVKSEGANIVSDETCLSVLQTDDQIASPKLKNLDEIDGTMGHLPELDSPAFGNGNSAVCAASPVFDIDQRGLAREYGCDIGAMELLQAAPPTSTPTATPDGGETPAVTPTPNPSETPAMTLTPDPAVTPDGSETPVATLTPMPSETPGPGAGVGDYILFLPLVRK